MIVLLVLAALVAAFVLGTVYGRKLEAAAVAKVIKFEATAKDEIGKAYAGVLMDIKAGYFKTLARVRKAL